MRKSDNVPFSHRYIKITLNNVMTNNKKIVLAFIALIVAAGLLVLNPSIIGDAQAQMYAKDYGYDSNYYSYSEPKESSHTDIQKIKCVNSNLNINCIDVTEVPPGHC